MRFLLKHGEGVSAPQKTKALRERNSCEAFSKKCGLVKFAEDKSGNGYRLLEKT